MGVVQHVSELASLLVFGQPDDRTESLIGRLEDHYRISRPETLNEVLHELRDNRISGVFLLGQTLQSAGLLVQAGGILDQVPDGVVLLGPELKILWANSRLSELTQCDKPLAGTSFYDAFGTPEILGPDFCPFQRRGCRLSIFSRTRLSPIFNR